MMFYTSFKPLFVGLLMLVGVPLITSAQSVDTVCYGTAPAAFQSTNAASGSLGIGSYLYEWQDSTAGGAWAAAPGMNNDTSYQASSLTQTTWFRRQVRVLTCAEIAYSNVLEVVVLDSLSVTAANVTNASCDNTADGSIEVNTTGGLPDYSYAWSNDSTTSAINELAPGSYEVTVTDAFGCSAMETVDVGFENAAPIMQFDADTLFMAQGFEELIGAPGSFEAYEWSTGSTDSTTEVTGSGNIYLTVTSIEGCSASDSIWIEITTGLANATINRKVKLFPNPARNSVQVQVGEGEMPELIEIRNLDGRLLRTERRSSTIDISTLASGVYLVNVQHGSLSYSGRLVVQ